MYEEHKPFDVSPYDHPDIYPGPRLGSSFLFWKGRAHRMDAEKGVPVEQQAIHFTNVDHVLGSLAFQSTHVKKVEEFFKEGRFDSKVPVVAYGSNVCLAQLQYKFRLRPEEDDFMLCLKGTVTDSDIVYAPFLAPYGSLPAVISPVKGAVSEVWLTFMDKKQLELINSTEKGYELRVHEGKKVRLDTGEVFGNVYAYYEPRALLWNGEMRRFKDISGNSPLQAVWQSEMLNELKLAVDHKGTREEFIHLLRWDRSYRDFIEDFLQAECTYTFDHPDWKAAETILSIGEMKRSF
ncbi:hypothetical protein B4U37_06425 [Sutcliffiella horikoshii]|uniref:Uncharacterized protein n=1 Tax=Sutcliffiella horikoshii TaxID=79883 RepID=A0A1Y0CL77_9BACI|nr:hypothetical protein [Sutcliffiella horikoshii]ART75685.1 hypothetical protein B4U37_06425 [Sutcliffiella horikoshii]TYS60967.1 hypothetical protein FZC74_01430 [Sutcliffiella horikoshii]